MARVISTLRGVSRHPRLRRPNGDPIARGERAYSQRANQRGEGIHRARAFVSYPEAIQSHEGKKHIPGARTNEERVFTA
eukprot:7160455-Pyramimonas_sp.AAC.1